MLGFWWCMTPVIFIVSLFVVVYFATEKSGNKLTDDEFAGAMIFVLALPVSSWWALYWVLA